MKWALGFAVVMVCLVALAVGFQLGVAYVDSVVSP
jgi:hypothetical protein